MRVETVLVSTQHTKDAAHEEIRDYVASCLLPEVLGPWFGPHVEILVNPTGQFIEGGPSADCGVTGRKIIVDSYGGMGRHGGGAFSGKDPSKVDRSGAYFGRFVARQVVRNKLASRAEVQVAYAIGRAQPVSVRVDTFGTGDVAAAADFVRQFDYRPAAMIERLALRRPIYRQTTNYGHFGKPSLSLGSVDLVAGWPFCRDSLNRFTAETQRRGGRPEVSGPSRNEPGFFVTAAREATHTVEAYVATTSASERLSTKTSGSLRDGDRLAFPLRPCVPASLRPCASAVKQLQFMNEATRSARGASPAAPLRLRPCTPTRP